MQIQELSKTITGGETYLITGASGFIGFSVVMALYYMNREVLSVPCKLILMVRDRNKAFRKFGNVLNDPDITVILCDNEDKIQIDGHLDWIIHTAAVTKKRTFEISPADTLNSNVMGIYNCLELAKKKSIKGMVFISSVQVYGKTDEEEIEENTFGPLNSMKAEAVYPESKRMGEMLCWAYNRQYHIPVKCVRLFHAYGKGEDYDNGTFLSDFFTDIIAGRNIHIKGSGEEIRNLCHISDVVRGIFYVLYKGEVGEAYNIASENVNYSIKEIAELLCRAAWKSGRKTRVVTENQEGVKNSLIKKQIPNVEKLKALGWKEERNDLEYNFEEIIEEILGQG